MIYIIILEPIGPTTRGQALNTIEKYAIDYLHDAEITEIAEKVEAAHCSSLAILLSMPKNHLVIEPGYASN